MSESKLLAILSPCSPLRRTVDRYITPSNLTSLPLILVGFLRRTQEIQNGQKSLEDVLLLFTPEQWQSRIHLVMSPTNESHSIEKCAEVESGIHWYFDGAGFVETISDFDSGIVLYRSGYPGVFRDQRGNIFAISDHHDQTNSTTKSSVRYRQPTELKLLSDPKYTYSLAQNDNRRVRVPSSALQTYLAFTLGSEHPQLPLAPLFRELFDFDHDCLSTRPIYVHLNDIDPDCVFSYLSVKYPQFLITESYKNLIHLVNLLDVFGGGFVQSKSTRDDSTYKVLQYIVRDWRAYFQIHNTSKNLNSQQKQDILFRCEQNFLEVMEIADRLETMDAICGELLGRGDIPELYENAELEGVFEIQKETHSGVHLFRVGLAVRGDHYGIDANRLVANGSYTVGGVAVTGKPIDAIIFWNGTIADRDDLGNVKMENGRRVQKVGKTGNCMSSVSAFTSDPNGLGVEELLGDGLMQRLGLDNGSATGNRNAGGTEMSLSELREALSCLGGSRV